MKCPVCGKQFTVLWPDLWRYKRGRNYLCGYGCMRMIDRGETVMDKFTKEQKAKAVEIALDGGDPKAYLESIGSKNPENLWYYIKAQLRKNDPETWEKLAGSPKRAPVETPESEFVPAGKPKPLDGGEWEKLEIPEAKKPAMKPVPPPIEYRVTGISTTAGDFRYMKRLGYIDWTTLTGETISMNLEEWKELMKVWPFVLKVLEVEL
jgi:hypothetical protein